MNQPQRRWASGFDTWQIPVLRHRRRRLNSRCQNQLAWLLAITIIALLIVGTLAIVYVLFVARW
jgi:hypothetical protein